MSIPHKEPRNPERQPGAVRIPVRGRVGRRRWFRVAATLAVLLVALSAAGQVSRIRTWAAHPAPGRLVDIGGFRLHLDCRGDAPGPTVVIDAGQGDYSLSYQELLPAIGAYARVCAYDRAGLGWSDPSPNPRTAQQIVTELRTLLDRAEESGPFVLVGQSSGGLYVRLFAYSHPSEVAGLVLLDAAHEDQFATVPDTFTSMVRVMPWLYGAMRLAASTGVPALVGWSGSYVPSSMPPGIAKPYKALAAASPKFLLAASRELSALPDTHAQLRAASREGLGDIPVVVLSHEICNGCGMLGPDQLEAYERNWREAQAAVAAQSSRGRWQIVPQSGHEVHLDRPDAVLDAIREVLAVVSEVQFPTAAIQGGRR